MINPDEWKAKIAEMTARAKLAPLSRETYTHMGVQLVSAGIGMMAYAMGDAWTKAALRDLMQKYDALSAQGPAS